MKFKTHSRTRWDRRSFWVFQGSQLLSDLASVLQFPPNSYRTNLLVVDIWWPKLILFSKFRFSSFSSLCTSHYTFLSQIVCISRFKDMPLFYVLLWKKKILPVKLHHTIIKCILISDTLKRWGGKRVLELMKHSISAAVNWYHWRFRFSTREKLFYCFLLFLIGFIVFTPFSGRTI